jgi:hypothetical protein
MSDEDEGVFEHFSDPKEFLKQAKAAHDHWQMTMEEMELRFRRFITESDFEEMQTISQLFAMISDSSNVELLVAHYEGVFAGALITRQAAGEGPQPEVPVS